MTDRRSWINVLPMHRWTALCNQFEEVEEVFRLESFEVINGIPKYVIETKGGRLIQSGLPEIKVFDNLSTRLYTPIELHHVPSIGLSPKLVFVLPKTHRIEPYEEPERIPQEKVVYDAMRRHQFTPLTGK